MPVPDFQSLMLPLLQAMTHEPLLIADLRNRVAAALHLSADDRAELLPSGRQPVFVNRISWANIALERAGLVERTGRGQYRITEEGSKVLSTSPQRIDIAFLYRYPKYREWRVLIRKAGESAPSDSVNAASPLHTPEEIIEGTHRALTEQLEATLLERMREVTPATFEHMMVELLIAMGYGGGRREMGEALGRSGDGGIDGVVKEDSLGLEVVYLQAKRYAADHAVGAPDINAFVGALIGRRATKGVFVTTSSFTQPAREYADRVPHRIVLIDGPRLASLMVAYGVGVRVRVSYDIKDVDEEFFAE